MAATHHRSAAFPSCEVSRSSRGNEAQIFEFRRPLQLEPRYLGCYDFHVSPDETARWTRSLRDLFLFALFLALSDPSFAATNEGNQVVVVYNSRMPGSQAVA